MKTINLELSKRLAPYLEDFDCNLRWVEKSEVISGDINGIKVKYTGEFFVGKPFMQRVDINNGKEYKTLTLEEAIEFLPSKINYGSLTISKTHDDKYDIFYRDFHENIDTLKDGEYYINFIEETLLQAIEKMLEYLLDNNLLK